MADYSDYSAQFQYMSRVIDSIKSQYSGIPSGIPVKVNFFSEVFRRAESRSVEAPESMDSIFKEAADRYDVPLNLLKAVAKAESNFDASVVSSAGAQGVMQLMPATAKALGVENPFDARENIFGGAKYLSDKLKQYNGDIELALASYNAGSGNVSKYGGVPPFPETINYIKKIKEYMGMDIQADRNVYTSYPSVNQSKLSKTMQVTDLENAQFMVELMKIKMQIKRNGLII